MSKKKNVVLMAWGGAKETAQQVTEFNKYTGILPVSIIALNPNKAELSKILGRDIEEEPSYIIDSKDGKPKTLRIELFVKPAGVEFEGIQFMNRINYFIRMEIMRNKDKTKVQVINKYGQTAWITNEQFDAKEAPSTSFAMPYRAALSGEAEFVEAIRIYFDVKRPDVYKDGAWELRPAVELKDCEGELDDSMLKKMARGDFSDLQKLVKAYPNNRIKYFFGVKIYEGKEYQTACTRVPIAPNARNLTRYFERLKYLMGTPSYQNTSFGQEPYVFGVYKPMASDFEQKESVAIPSVADPFADNENPIAANNDAIDDLPF